MKSLRSDSKKSNTDSQRELRLKLRSHKSLSPEVELIEDFAKNVNTRTSRNSLQRNQIQSQHDVKNTQNLRKINSTKPDEIAKNKMPVPEQRRLRSARFESNKSVDYYKKLDLGKDKDHMQGSDSNIFDQEESPKFKDRKKRRNKASRKQIQKGKKMISKSKNAGKQLRVQKKTFNIKDEQESQAMPKFKESVINDNLVNGNVEIVNRDQYYQNFFEILSNLIKFHYDLEYFKANQSVKCSERIYQEYQDGQDQIPLDLNLGQINSDREDLSELNQRPVNGFGLSNQLKQDFNFPKKNGDAQKSQHQLSQLQQDSPNRECDSISLAFPEQPKTKVIAEEILQQQQLEQERQREESQQLEQNQDDNHKIDLGSNTFINCDIRFFNLQYLVDQLGHFEVVLIDPPWRIKGAQRNNTSFMFSNNKFNLDYSTMSNSEIMNLPIEVLSRKGFCFLWILNSQMHIGYECLNKWGYEVVDQLTWVKTKNKKIHISHGFYFLHSSETCLVGYKCPPNEYIEFKSKVSNNLIIAEIRKKSQKPDQLYTLIDLLIPGSKKIEIFARNNNLRSGWLSLGNQLGENYVNWKNVVNCDRCQKDIKTGNKRYKSKIEANNDLCQKCFSDLALEQCGRNEISSQEEIKDFDEGSQQAFLDFQSQFYVVENATDEDILHEYHQCNICHAEPIWGLRFKCSTCEDVDLCETCFDSRLQMLNLREQQNDSEEIKLVTENNSILCENHSFQCVELPLLADGLAAHNQYKCVSCYMRPIIGACFICADCNHFSLCQNCYFTRPFQNLKVRGHSDKHKIELIVEPRQTVKKYVKCNGCGEMPIQNVRFKCDNCFDFDFCEKCYKLYALEKRELKTIYSTSHKNYHTFTKFMLALNNPPKASENEKQNDKEFEKPHGKGHKADKNGTQKKRQPQKTQSKGRAKGISFSQPC